jgi:hypothetical protein
MHMHTGIARNSLRHFFPPQAVMVETQVWSKAIMAQPTQESEGIREAKIVEIRRVEEEEKQYDGMEMLLGTGLWWALQRVACRSQCKASQDPQITGGKELRYRRYEGSRPWLGRVVRGRSVAPCISFAFEDSKLSKPMSIYELTEEKPRRRSRHKSKDRRSSRQ